MKAFLKRTLSLLLTMILIISSASIALATVTITAHSDVYIVVPETIYLTPSTGASTTPQYYVNNTFNSSTNAITLDAQRAATAGKVYFKCADAKSVTVTASSPDSSRTFNNFRCALSLSNGYGSNTNFSGFTLSTGVTAGNVTLMQWNFTATMSDNTTETFVAYTVLYSPYYSPVGVSLRSHGNYSTYTDCYAGTVAWISGINSYSVPSSYNWDKYNDLNEFERVYPRAYTNTGSNQYSVTPLITAAFVNNNGNANAFGYITRSSSDTPCTNSFVWSTYKNRHWYNENLKHSFDGNINVDVSRIDNLNEIPNLTFGFIICDSNNASDTHYYIDEITQTLANESSGDANSQKRNDSYTKDSKIRANGTRWYQRRGETSIVDYYAGFSGQPPAGGVGSRQIYNGAWNKAIEKTSKTYYVKAAYHYKQNHNNSNESHKYLMSILHFNVIAVDKSNLRNTIMNCVKAGMQRSWYSCTDAQWSTYQTELRNAYLLLGNVNTTSQSTVNSAETSLKNAFIAVKNTERTSTSQALHFGVVKTLDSTGNVSGYQVKSTLAANDDGTKTFKSSDKVTIAANTYSGYTYKGSVVTASDYDVGSAINLSSLNTASSYTSMRGYPILSSNQRNLSHYYLAADSVLTINPVKSSVSCNTSITASVGSTFTVPDPAPREGYAFAGWTYVGSGSFNAASGVVTFGSGTATLTATWTPTNDALTADDTYIDFGIKKYIDVTANDAVLFNDYASSQITVVGIGAQSAYAQASSSQPSGFSASYGNLSVSNNKLLYSPAGQLTSSQTYSVLIKAGSTYVCSYLTVVPSSSIYYEDDYSGFVTYTDSGSAVWQTVGTSKLGSVVESSDSGVDGFTDVYNLAANASTYSMGSAHKVTVSGSDSPTASFSFAGTGFDVYALTSKATGIVLVTVKNSSGNTVKRHIVDTYCGFTKGEDGYEISSLDTAAYYQVPVISVGGLAYGSYTVEVTPRYSAMLAHGGATSSDFYLDSVRIYNPSGEQSNSSAYKMRTIALGSSDSNAFLLNANGAVITKNEYQSAGSTNELYLAANQSVAFTLSGGGSSTKVYISAHAPSGTAAQLTCSTSSVTEKHSVNTATELYYAVNGVTWTNGSSSVITVTNTGSAPVSLCKLIIVGSSASAAANASPVMTSAYLDEANALIARSVSTQASQFYPEQLTAASGETAEQGESVSVSVTTSADVKSLTIAGECAAAVSNEDGTVTWTLTVSADEAGELTLPVVAYNENGIASATAEITVSVSEKTAQVTQDGEEVAEDGQISDSSDTSQDENAVVRLFTKLKSFIKLVITFLSDLLG